MARVTRIMLRHLFWGTVLELLIVSIMIVVCRFPGATTT